MPINAYLNLEGMETKVAKYGLKDLIPLLSFSLGASRGVDPQAEGGMASMGPVHITGFNFVKKTDKVSPTLFQACCQGKHFKKAVVTLFRDSGQTAPIDFLKYEFESVYLDSLQFSGAGGSDEGPTEAGAFQFQKITVTYAGQDAAGNKTSPVVASYDQFEGK